MKKLFSLIPALLAWAFACVKTGAYNILMRLGQRTGAVAFVGPFAPDMFPTFEDFNRYRIQNANTLQIVRASLYDTVLYPTAGATSISMFVDAIGAGQSVHPGAAAGVKKNKFDTNMVSSGTLPRFTSFVVESIELYFTPGSISTANLFALVAPGKFIAAAAVTQVQDLNDINVFYNSGFLSFDISSGNILTEAPLRKFPPKADLGIDGGLSSNSATTAITSALYGTAKGRPYDLQPLVTLQETASFALSVNWPNALATPSGFNGQIRCVLDGYSVRATQ